MVCAGYCAYGSATELVITYGHGVERFTLDPSIGEFILTGEKMTLPEVCKTIYSINEGNYLTWDPHMQKAIDGFRLNKPAYTARYVGSMVADIHRTLLYGGIYLYPADAAKVYIYLHFRRLQLILIDFVLFFQGNGKLRVLYEAFPMAKIMEDAGGSASTGWFKGGIHRILDLKPNTIHDKCPVIIGCNRDVDRVLAYYNK